MEAGKAAFLAGNDDTHHGGAMRPVFRRQGCRLVKLNFPGGENEEKDEANDVMNKLSEEIAVKQAIKREVWTKPYNTEKL